MTTQEKTFTADDLWELSRSIAETNQDYELIDGHLHPLTPGYAIPSIIAGQIGSFISAYVDDHNIGWAVGARAGFVLSPHNVLAPDAAFISKTRLPTLPDGFCPVAPDLAVEVVSPTDSVKATQRKAAKYLEFGTQLVWIVYPNDRTVDVCSLVEGKPGMNIQEIGLDGTLDGGKALPGFTLSLRDIFKVIE